MMTRKTDMNEQQPDKKRGPASAATAGYTAGPWRWVPWQGGRGWAVYSAETLVCTCTYEGPESAETRAMNDANGTLIAEVPALVQALRDAIRRPQGVVPDSALPFLHLIQDEQEAV